MITALTASNFRSLGERTRVEFGQFTALVGPNGSGKSSVVDALRFVSDAVTIGLSGAITHSNGISSVRRWSSGRPFNVSLKLELKLEGGPASYHFELVGDKAEEYRVKFEEAVVPTSQGISFRVEDGEWVKGPSDLRPPLDRQGLALQLIGGDARFAALVEALQRIAIYSIFPDTLREPQRYSPARPMERHGANWVSILKDQPEETWKPELVQALHQLTGDIEDLRVEPAASFLIAQFRHAASGRRPKWFDAAQESDGTLRVAGIVTALLQEPPVPVVGIEEPELTVHPGAIPLLFDYLAQASRRSQVIMTTHSPDLLDKVDADDVRVVRRMTEGTIVARMDQDQRDAVRSGLMSIGDVLRTEGLQPDLPLVFEP